MTWIECEKQTFRDNYCWLWSWFFFDWSFLLDIQFRLCSRFFHLLLLQSLLLKTQEAMYYFIIPHEGLDLDSKSIQDDRQESQGDEVFLHDPISEHLSILESFPKCQKHDRLKQTNHKTKFKQQTRFCFCLADFDFNLRFAIPPVFEFLTFGI